MRGAGFELIHIVRDFLVAHQTMRRVFHAYRAGTLEFAEVQKLVDESEDSVLFRIKERCHALFRAANADGSEAVRREVLFDLAVGSLFHEAMKFRENFYQREVYAPRVRALRDAASEDTAELFGEFEKILDGAELRLVESLQEAEILLDQTCRQFRLLLLGYRDYGLITRYLIERRDVVDELFEEGLEGLLADMHGEAAAGFVVAARSYLESAYFTRAAQALAEARRHYADRKDLRRLAHYADGMQSFQRAAYAESLCFLAQWLDEGPDDSERGFAELAHTALAGIEHLVSEEERSELAARAKVLSGRLDALIGDVNC